MRQRRQTCTSKSAGHGGVGTCTRTRAANAPTHTHTAPAKATQSAHPRTHPRTPRHGTRPTPREKHEPVHRLTQSLRTLTPWAGDHIGRPTSRLRKTPYTHVHSAYATYGRGGTCKAHELRKLRINFDMQTSNSTQHAHLATHATTHDQNTI